MNKENLTYIIIGIVAVVIIIFLINSNQSKQEILSLPILTLPPLNSETINSINIYDLSNETILKPTIPITSTLPPITTTISVPTISVPTTTLPPITSVPIKTTSIPTTTYPLTTTLLPTTTLSPTTTFLPTTTSVSITTTSPPKTTFLPTTTLSPALQKLKELIIQQEELVRRLKEQKQKDEEDLFNIPLIPIFNSNEKTIVTTDGLYQIIVLYHSGTVSPIYNISSSYNANYGGNSGNLFDNNDTTGIIFEKINYGNRPTWEALEPFDFYIIITMPVKKTFKGKLKMNLSYPRIYGPLPPQNMTINTADILTINTLSYNDSATFFINNYYKDLTRGYNYSSNSESKIKYLDSVSLEINKDNSIQKSWDLNLVKPFNCIIFKFNALRINGFDRVCIASINFEKSR